MGKWTTGYYDDVLSAKIKSMVSGTIKRSKLDKSEPTISYEHFVEDLDIGDSFTTSVIEILVKELAERRTRALNDRKLIADRTAKNLRTLAAPIRIFRDHSIPRRHLSRRSANLSEYLTNPPDELDIEEDDDFEDMLETTTSTIEGARVNSDLYDAYGGNHTGWTPGGLQFARRTTPPAAEEPTPNAASRSPPSSIRTFPHNTGSMISATNLSRQSSIRRPPRPSSRAVDFSDFTSRRRSSIRDSAVGSRSESNDTSEPQNNINLDRENSWPRPSHTRRFFPFSRTHRDRGHDSATSWNHLWSETPGGDEDDYDHTHLDTIASFATNWTPISPGPIRSSSRDFDAETSDERTGETPRLRRGGLRAPESMLSRHASPASATQSNSPPVIDPMPPTLPLLIDVTGDYLPTAVDGGYPTPGSIVNDGTL